MARGIWTSVGGDADLDVITAGAGDVLAGKTIADKEGEPVTGTMPNKGAWGTSLGINGNVTIPAGYHNGAGKVTQSIPVFNGQTVTPSKSAQTVSCAGKYASGNVVINAIPSNFTDLTGGRVGFNETAFYSPLDGGVRSTNADGRDSLFYGIASEDNVLSKAGWGLKTYLHSNYWCQIVCNHSVNLTDISRIEVYVKQDTRTRLCIQNLNRSEILKAELLRTGTVTVNTSALTGHHFIVFEHDAFNMSPYLHAALIKKITFY